MHESKGCLEEKSMDGGLVDVLMIACYVLRCDRGFGGSLSGYIVQLSTDSEYST